MLKRFLLIAATLMSATSIAIAAPVAGFESGYNDVYNNCTLPSGGFSADPAERDRQIEAGLEACEAAINAYAGSLVSDVELQDAEESFIGLRQEVFKANEPDEEWQALVDALFERLLPNSGAIVFASPTT